ncbi:hypothetical protein AAFX60_001450 [Aliivibrio fischeri]
MSKMKIVLSLSIILLVLLVCVYFAIESLSYLFGYHDFIVVNGVLNQISVYAMIYLLVVAILGGARQFKGNTTPVSSNIKRFVLIGFFISGAIGVLNFTAQNYYVSKHNLVLCENLTQLDTRFYSKTYAKNINLCDESL